MIGFDEVCLGTILEGFVDDGVVGKIGEEDNGAIGGFGWLVFEPLEDAESV